MKSKGECWSDLEDLAFRNRPSRESDRLGRRECLEHEGIRVLKLILAENKVHIGRRFAGFEKGGEGMALKT
ncbi:MAG: hypothetical protein DRJ11_10000 [Candidatus Aminicenantes bacterium]|nr:MAG: hypothetical protein DRJ11_10000 [Candidatus Aminicenantes bacterium]